MFRDNKNRRLLNILLIVLSAVGIIVSVILLGYTYAQSEDVFTPLITKNAVSNKHVLFISSYSDTQDTVHAQLRGLEKIFTKNNVYLDVEYMDMKNYNSLENIRLFFQTMQYKLSHH